MTARRGANIFGLWAGAGLAVAVFGLLTLGERRRPLRRSVEAKGRRLRRNLAVAAVSAAVIQIADRPLTRRAAAVVEARRWGLAKRLGLPRWTEEALAFLLLDYTLWSGTSSPTAGPRCGGITPCHHADLDLDASTGIRFHPVEMLASVPWRLAQVVLIGAGPRALGRWQSALFLSVLFHHSNLRLPRPLERALAHVFVTPRQHGIHHSVVRDEMDSNWSSLLNVWDRLHGTLRLDVPQDAITIGLPSPRDPRALAFPRLMAMPFEERPCRLS
jgi:sterol desaturase/sphingolipid hydroxylase (fatty acid hydroxylase superfamily)